MIRVNANMTWPPVTARIADLAFSHDSDASSGETASEKPHSSSATLRKGALSNTS